MKTILHFVVLCLFAPYLQAQIPAAPSDLFAANITPTATDLNWSGVTNDPTITGYKLYKNGELVETILLTSYVVTGLLPNTIYTFKVTAMNSAGNESNASNLATITTDEFIQFNYCTSQSADVNEEYISTVQIASIDNSSDARFYSDFTNLTTDLVKNGQYNITITPTWTGTSYNEGYAVWIDYNQNGNFNDSGEQVFVHAPTAQTSVNTIITIPTSAPNGVTRMRVSMKYDAIPGQCETFTYGEVEDYSVNIISATSDPIQPFLTLIGDNPIEIFVNDTYIDAGATAIDNVDGDISGLIVATGTVNTAVAGTYTIRYNVRDTAGNEATEITRTVIVNEVNIGCNNGIDTFPYTEGFENTLGGWTQSTQDDIDWTQDANGTPSQNTGPNSAIEGNSYLYVEASGNGAGYPDKQAILTSPCFDLGGLTEATFSFNYHMLGTDMGTLAVEISEDNGATWTSIWTQTGNQGSEWQTANIDISTYTGSNVQLRFNRITGSTWRADIAIDNISLIDQEIIVEGCSGGVGSFPYAESYENTLGDWTQSSADDINWTVDANGTPSNGTGPSSATEGSFYIFVEASGNGTGFPNKQAIINSPCYDLTNELSAEFSFSYHMFGSDDMGTIALEASNDNGLSWTTLWSESGNKGNQWLTANVDLAQYVGGSVQLRFNRVTGGTWQADIAIDNITLKTLLAARQKTTTTKDQDVALIVDSSSANTLTVFPNPVKGSVLNIKLAAGTFTSYRIINLYGQVITAGTASNQIKVNKLQSGVYFIEVSDGNNTLTKKFIKQ